MDWPSQAPLPEAAARATDLVGGASAEPFAPARGLPALLAWHRRLGLVALTGVVLWSVSGLLHPIMTRLQPAPAKFRVAPQVPTLDGAAHPAEILRAHGIDTVADLRAVAWNGVAAYQVTLPDQPERRYFAVQDGRPLADGDRRYAEYLAREYLSDMQAGIARARLVTEFGYEYSYINRLLPVWRIEFERPDHMRVFVDTRTGAWARSSTTCRRSAPPSSRSFTGGSGSDRSPRLPDWRS